MKKAYAFWNQVLTPDGRSQEQFLREEAENHTLGELAAQLPGRSGHAIRLKLDELGLRAKVPALPEAVRATQGKGTIADVNTQKFLAAIKDKPKSRKELSQEFDRSEETIETIVAGLQALSYEIIRTENETVLWPTRSTAAVPPPPTLWDEEYGHFLIGVISDLHGGSKWAQWTNLRRCVQEMYEAGVRDILVPGDITAGLNVYRGQIHDLVTTSGPEQVGIVCEYLPQYPDLEYEMIGGNHDASFIKQNGFNPVDALAKARDDIVYAGFDLADVPITPQIDARLWHPMGGIPYAYSYRMQKAVEQMAFAELLKVIDRKKSPRLRMLFAGHLHIWLDFHAGPILCLQIPCFEGQTPYLKRKGGVPEIGGVILEFELTVGGMIRRHIPQELRFDEIDNDYLNYPVPVQEEIKVEPLFQWVGEEQAA